MKKEDKYKLLLIAAGIIAALACGIMATRYLIKKKKNDTEDIDKNSIVELVKHYGE